ETLCLNARRRAPRERRRSESRNPPHAAYDNETLDHLLSLVDGKPNMEGFASLRNPSCAAPVIKGSRSVSATLRVILAKGGDRAHPTLANRTPPLPVCAVYSAGRGPVIPRDVVLRRPAGGMVTLPGVEPTPQSFTGSPLPRG